MSETLLMIGTRKGLWLARSEDRRTWSVEGPDDPVNEIHSVAIDTRGDHPRLGGNPRRAAAVHVGLCRDRSGAGGTGSLTGRALRALGGAHVVTAAPAMPKERRLVGWELIGPLLNAFEYAAPGRVPGSRWERPLAGVENPHFMEEAARLGVYERRLPMFERIEPTGVRWSDGTFEPVDVILWATGFRAALDHLAPLGLREPGGGIRTEGVRVLREPRVHYVKGFYQRPLRQGDILQAEGGGVVDVGQGRDRAELLTEQDASAVGIVEVRGFDGDDDLLDILVLEARRAEARNAKPYLRLTLGDRTGTIDAFVWEEVERWEPVCVVDAVAATRAEGPARGRPWCAGSSRASGMRDPPHAPRSRRRRCRAERACAVGRCHRAHWRPRSARRSDGSSRPRPRSRRSHRWESRSPPRSCAS